MNVAPLPPDRPALLRAQRRNLARLRAAVTASPTCTALHPHAPDLTPGRLARVPTTSRDQLARWCDDPAGPHRITTGDVRLVLRSSGSGGRPRTIAHSRGFNDQVEALGARGLCWQGLGPNPLVVNAMAPGDLFGGFGFVEAALRARAGVLPLGPAVPTGHVARLVTDLGVEAVVATAGHLARLLHAEPAAMARLRVMFNLGDAVPADVAHLAARHGVTVRSFAYSTTETGPIGYQCAHLHGTDHHVHEDHVLAEVLDDDAVPLPPGREGALAVTVLTTTGVALVRYLVGDRATWLPGACACGSPAAVLRLGGRDATSTNLDSTLVTRDMVDAALAPLGVPAGARYQVLARVERGLVHVSLRGPALAGVEAGEALAAFTGHGTLRRVVTSPRFRGLSVDPHAPLRTTSRGKCTFFAHEGDSHE